MSGVRGRGPRPAPARAALVCLLAVVTVLTGCGLHTPSGVRVDQRSIDTAADDPDIRKLPPGPVPGAGPGAVVQAFLEASGADPDDTYAQAFLASGAVWVERSSAQVYRPDTLRITTSDGASADAAVVRVTARVVGTLTTGGAFTPTDRTIDVAYRLVRVAGQWRIFEAPPGILLAPRDLSRTYRLIRTYAFNADRSALVAQPGYIVSDRAGLAGAALHALLSDWSGTLAPVDGSAQVDLTDGLTALGSVVVRDGEATVDLGREAFNVPQSLRPLVVAQIAATLGTVPGVFTVRVLVEERPYVGDPVPAEVPAAYAAASRGPTLAISSAGELVTSTPAGTAVALWTQPVDDDGPSTAPPRGLRLPAVAPNGTDFAVLQPGTRPGLLLGRVVEAAASSASGAQPIRVTERRRVTLPPADYLRPQWLDRRRLLVAGAGDAPVLRVVETDTGEVRPLSASTLPAGPLAGLVVSRDGTRAIATIGPEGRRQAYLGRALSPGTGADPVTNAGDRPGETALPELGDWTPLPTDLADVASAGWPDDLSVALLGRPADSSAAVRAVVLSLEQVTAPTVLAALPAELRRAAPAALAIAVAPGHPVVVSSGLRRWVLDTGSWSALPPAADTTYG